MSKNILIIEDDETLAEALSDFLRESGYETSYASTLSQTLNVLRTSDINLIILDVHLGIEDGYTLCQEIRTTYDIPILFLTGCSSESEIIQGFSAGGDDYVTKPFRPLEVVARVKAQLRRYKKYSPDIITEKIPSELSYNKLCLNVQTHECLLDGEPVSLTPTEFSILHVLLSSAGNVVSIEELFHAVWKDEYYSKNSSTITVHIRHLREKLNDTSDTPQYIKTIWGVGYKI